MLRFLRKYSNSTGIKILYGVLAGLFVVWGVGAVGSGQRVDVVARVYGEDITRRDVERQTAELERRYRELLEGRFGGDLLRSLNLREQAVNQLVDQALVRHEARRLGIGVSTADVDKTIMSVPAFQENGHFNRELLKGYLQAARQTGGELEASLAQGLLQDRVQSVVADGVQVNDAEIEERYRLDHEQVSLRFVRIAAAPLEAEIKSTDEELEKDLADHSDRYRVPARVRARYAAYRPADFVAEVHLTDGDIAEYYALHKDDQFTRQEQARARRILVEVAPGADDKTKSAARKKADDLLAKIRKGADFAEVAKKSSDDHLSAPKGGDLGFFPRGSKDPAFENAASALEPGKVSDVVETAAGFEIIRLEEHTAAGPRPIEAVREEIRHTLEGERALQLARTKAEADRRAIVRGKPLAEVVATAAETPPFAVGTEVPGLGRVPGFTEAAFALATGEVSDLIETAPPPAIYLITPLERSEPHTPPLAEVRERVASDLRRERGEATARERGEKLLARAKEIGLDKAAAEVKVSLEETGSFDRKAASIPKLGSLPDLRGDAFTLTADAPLAVRVYSLGEDAVVAALSQRTPADMNGLASSKESLQKQLLERKRQVVFESYMKSLRERAGRDGALELLGGASARG